MATGVEIGARPLSAALGAEVDLDVRAPVDAPTRRSLLRLLDRHRLLCFRAPGLTPARHVEVASWFGPVLDESTDGSRTSLVSNTHPEGRIREGRLLFHSDLAFVEHPIDAISLFAIEVPDDGSPTLFANAARAVDRLPPEVRDELAARSVCNIFDLRAAKGDRRFRVAELPATAPRATHPALRTHPRTGEPVLYCNEMHTDSVVGCDPEHSEALLDAAKAVLYAPGNVYEHRWRAGDLLVWDNVALQHARGDIDGGGTRTLRRVAIGVQSVQLQKEEP